MRTVLLSKADESYLQKCAQEHKFAYGIIIGHQAEPDKSIVVHLARNNEEDADMEDLTDVVLTVDDINSQALASQWLSASKMCPGSFDVLGLFVSSVRSEVVNEQSDEFKNAKKLFADVYDLLVKSEAAFGASTTDIAQTDYVFLAYTPNQRNILCKSYTYSNGGTFSPMECRFVEKPFEWITFECNYDVDDVYPIFDTSRRINIEQQFQNIIKAARQSLDASEVFLQNETVDDMVPLQAYVKKKKDENQPYDDVFKATIMLPIKCQLSQNTDIKVREFSGTLRMSGIVSSRIYCNPRNTLGNVKRFIRNDILRSLLTRIQIYCDGLTDPHVSNEALYISEPPRRVYFSLPTDEGTAANSSGSNIQFSEYIFRGEAPTVAVAQAKQILDVDVDAASINLDTEGLPDEQILSGNSSLEMDTRSPVQSRPELSRSMYMLGIVVALLVLCVSIALHYALAK